MKKLSNLKPGFWDHLSIGAEPYKPMFDFRHLWKVAVAASLAVTLAPLVFMTVIDYKVTRTAVESEISFRTSRLVSNTRRTVAFFLAERKSALDFIVQTYSFEELNDPALLSTILENLRSSFGGFADMGVIDPLGYQRTYVGPYGLAGRDYSGQEWYEEVLDRGLHISDVFLGYRNMPHLVIAARHEVPGSFHYVLRATLDIERFQELLSGIELSGLGDVFIVNHEGVLQTPSRTQGKVLDKIALPVPAFSPTTQVLDAAGPGGDPLLVGYAYIEGTPFILMVVKQKRELMKPWHQTRWKIIGFFAISVFAIMIVIAGVATYLVNRVYLADQRRVMAMHQVEYSNKMASLGRLAAGVAHEINNPLAIINEKAGLIKDLFTFKEGYKEDPKLTALVNGVIASVDRCAAITRRLLTFARHVDVKIEWINLKTVILDVLGFLGKEAEYRSIAIGVDVPDDIPQVETDRGKFQEVILNILNNAFAAVKDGGRVDIGVRHENRKGVTVFITDNGCGIPEEHLKRVFEPFFSTKTKYGGTGLGLSITYGLVKEMGGNIEVKSRVGVGTTFTIQLPLTMSRKETTRS